MSHPKSVLRRLRRRPSAAMGVAVVALFLAIGGASYAAIRIPNNSISNAMLKNNSVGNVKLRTNAVSYQKIAPGSVGDARIDQKEIQESVTGTCTTTGQAITSIAEKGTVTCGATLPSEYDSGPGTSVAVASATTPATLASYTLPGGTSYLVQSDPYVKVTPDAAGVAEYVNVSCTLAAGTSTSATQTRTTTVFVPATATAAQVQYESIPLTVAEPTSANSTTADVTCTEASSAGAPTVAAQTTVFATQTAANTSAPAPAKAH